MAPRGPDGTGAWSSGSVGLGHLLLCTTPESIGERQPVIADGTEVAITADLRLDNRTDLLSVLPLRPDASDAEIVLTSYERWGEDCVQHLLGDFAFALWDGRRRRIFAARDHMGIKPFYYHHLADHRFVFASEIKGVLGCAAVPRRLNHVRAAQHFALDQAGVASTFYMDVMRLPPAHHLTVTERGVRLTRYWSLDPRREITLGSDGEYAEAFRDLFTEAVRCRLRSVSPIGVFLSGGLDSSSVACVARKLRGAHGEADLGAYSVLFDDVQACDEREFIAQVTTGSSLTTHHVIGDRLEPLSSVIDCGYQRDEPTVAANMYLSRSLYAVASAQGVRVVLDGLDGDTTVSHGMARLGELRARRRWGELWREIQAIKRLRDLGWKDLWTGVVRPEVLKSSATSARLDHFTKLTGAQLSLALDALDLMGAEFTVETRHPFFDRRLVEFCLALPAEQKRRDGWGRLVLRNAMGGILPPGIQWRRDKSRLVDAFTLAFRRDLVRGAKLPELAVVGEYMDLHDVQDARERYLANGNEVDATTLWSAVTLASWLTSTRFDASLALPSRES